MYAELIPVFLFCSDCRNDLFSHSSMCKTTGSVMSLKLYIVQNIPHYRKEFVSFE